MWEATKFAKKLPMIETTQRSIRSLAYSRDGTLMASGALDGTARLFDVATGAELLNLKHDKNVNAVALDRDAKRLAVAGADKTARIYTLKTGETPPTPKPDPKSESPNARQTVEAFLDAAIAGKVEDALANATISENKVKDFQKAGIKRVDISIVLADDSEALTISEPIDLDKEGKGHMLLYLLKKDGRWKVRDIDFEPAEKAIRKQRDFLESHPEAKAVKARK